MGASAPWHAPSLPHPAQPTPGPLPQTTACQIHLTGTTTLPSNHHQPTPPHNYNHPAIEPTLTNTSSTPPPPPPQVQYSLLDRRPENGMADFCAQHGIKLLPYGVLAGGFLSDKYLGASPKQ